MNQGEPNNEYLAAVGARITTAILDFCAPRIGCHFHADDLRRHVAQSVGHCAPGSADRVLRDLRQRGAIDYVVVSRSKSLYHLRASNSAFDLV